MLKLATILSGLLVSASVFAATPNFSALSLGDGHRHIGGDHGGGHHGGMPDREKMRECIHEGWQAAEPTDEQNAAAHAEMQKIRAIFEANKDAVHEAMRTVMAAWKKHPVSKEEVSAAEEAAGATTKPLREAARDGQINIVNLLSAEQRADFDDAVKECIHND